MSSNGHNGDGNEAYWNAFILHSFSPAWDRVLAVKLRSMSLYYIRFHRIIETNPGIPNEKPILAFLMRSKLLP